MQKLSGAENAVLGTIAGGIEVCIDQPMLYWKNATQQKLPFTMNPKIVYRGLGASVTNMAVLTGLQFISTGWVKNIITGGANRELSASEAFAAALAGGALSGLACCPMELVMIQQQRFAGTIVGTPARIVASFGVTGLARGMVPSVTREAIFTGGMLGIAPSLQTFLAKNYGVNDIQAGFYGATIGALFAATITHPFDTVKTCMQGDIEQKTYTTVTKIFQEQYREQGLRRMYTGWGWRCGRMVCAMFWINLIKDKLAPVIYPHHFEGDEAQQA